MFRFNTFIRRTLPILAGLLIGTSIGSAQGLEGDWFYRGFFTEVNGGSQKGFAHDFDVGTFNFVNSGGDNYRVTIVDPGETEVFDLTLPRNGNTFSGYIPADTNPDSVSKEEIRIILDGDYAYMTTLDWSTSTGFVTGLPFQSSTAVYLLSRNALPTQDASRWTGNYAYRLLGQAQVWGGASRVEAVDVASISIDASFSGFTANYQGSYHNTPDGTVVPGLLNFDVPLSPFTFLVSDTLGLVGESSANIPGTIDEGDVVDWDSANRYSMAIQVNDTEVVWLQSTTTLGTYNTGTTNQYYVVASMTSTAGRATRTVETAPTISRHPADVSVLTGGEAFFSVDASGAPTPTYAWETSTDGGISWNPLINFDTENFKGANTTTLVVKIAAAADGQQFRVSASNSAGTATSDTSTLKILAEPTARLPNLSVRTTLAGAQNLAVGFVMTGGSKPLLIRAVGPTLGDFGVGDSMPNPRLGFNNASGVEIDANDDWDASLTTTFSELGAFALGDGSKDAALRVDLSGLGTVSVNGPEGGTVLVEVYDIGDSNDTRLANVSARNDVGTGNNILIAGFVVSGADPKNMLIRAVGPGLERFIGSGVLRDPLLKIFDSGSNLVATNDNWSPSLQPSFDLTGAFAIDNLSLDAALVVTLPPGAYTAQVSGADGGTGQAIVEIYELP